MVSVILLLLGLGALGLLAALGLRLGGKNGRWVGLVLPALGARAVPSLVGWSVDHFGVVERAVVADRRESIELRSNGGWYPRYTIAIRLPGARSAAMIWLRADQPTYDALQFGDPVEVRSLPISKSVMRLEKMPSSGWIRSAAAFEWAGILGTAALVLGGLVLIGGQGRAALIRGALVVALLSFGARSWYGRVQPYRGEVEPVTPLAIGRGTVRNVWRIAELYGGLGLAQPYLLVATEFTPAGARSSVRSIDAIDAGSVDHLELGDQIEVRYSSGSPRHARLGFGTRNFGPKNRGTARVVLGVVLGVLVGLGAFRWWLATARRPAAKAR